MPKALSNPVKKVYTEWAKAIRPVVGAKNYSMGSSSEIATAPYAQLKMLGNPGVNWDNEGNECATQMTFQCESYADGQTAIMDAYDIDAKAHEAMTNMHFMRIYGPELVDNADQHIKRVLSRYRRKNTEE